MLQRIVANGYFKDKKSAERKFMILGCTISYDIEKFFETAAAFDQGRSSELTTQCSLHLKIQALCL